MVESIAGDQSVDVELADRDFFIEAEDEVIAMGASMIGRIQCLPHSFLGHPGRIVDAEDVVLVLGFTSFLIEDGKHGLQTPDSILGHGTVSAFAESHVVDQ